ncbi:glucose dehydrogenase [FAD, quinone] [Lutzomyia longipalpis]|uniref:glucose dehydrogenase [FAD, quinone] n=1 Tax=Lutzomyia longipalpis TaxID=7200 RepID=UPI002483B578|nr:glucose dehydrogenase [FAD, quinone] [Lutzomyia longipalpis]XP_055679235.1 glucose dehydrogenase [FAD, quinone] [Lutzomyia longipalpis]XP_055679237.1 glucose dehydrogenase [FAD, quinone] [Lutzomyia longipalpis]
MLVSIQFFALIILSSIYFIPHTCGQEFLQTLFTMGNDIYFSQPLRDTVEFQSQYDFIVVGAGSAGAAVAGRLAEVSDFSVLLLEAGQDETILTDVPLSASLNQLTGANWGYKPEPSKKACVGLKGGVCNWPKGRVMGGTSVLNYLVFNRGHRKDFDGWAAAGNTGWSYNDVLPYFKKLENVKVPQLKDSRYRGMSGPVSIDYSPFQTKMLTSFLETGQRLGYKINDPNGEQMLGFSKIQATLLNGRRCSSSKAYIRPMANRPNLHISMKSWVTRIIIDPITKIAVGVEFLKNKQKYVVRAAKEIILSAGVIGSPQLLMLSGVGPADHLKSVGIPLIQDLKVGYNLQDHMSLPGLVFLIDKPLSVRERDVNNPLTVMNYFFFNSGPLTIPGGSEGYAFMKVPNSTLPDDYPDIEIVLGTGGLNNDDSRAIGNLLGIPEEFYKKTYGPILGKHSFSLVPVLMKTRSRGRITLRSKNPFHWPKMVHNYNEDKEDVRTLVEGIKLCVKIAESESFKKYGAHLNRIPYRGCENEIFGSDKYWECCIRQIGSSLQHQAGTCKMGPASDSDAVVNPYLQVHGIRNLRVADASIIPVIPAAHTNAVAMMIGEKAADMIKDYWKNSV